MGPISTYTLAEPPISLSTTSITQTSVGLTWSTNGNTAGTLYGIERSTDGVNFIQIDAVTAITYADQTVVGGLQYFYRVRAFNGDGAPSDYSNIVTAVVPAPLVSPKTPGGFWAGGATVGSAYQVTYHWRAVTERTDGSPLTNLVGYQIFKSNNILAPENEWVLISTITDTSWTTTSDPNSTAYYAVRAIDASELTSGYTHSIDDSPGLIHYFISSDGFSRAQVPQMAANVFAKKTTLMEVIYLCNGRRSLLKKQGE